MQINQDTSIHMGRKPLMSHIIWLIWTSQRCNSYHIDVTWILHRCHSLWLPGIAQRGHPDATSQYKGPPHSFPPQPIWFGLAPAAEISKCTTVTLSLKVALLRVSWTQTHLIVITLFQIPTCLKILTESSDSQHMRRETSRKHVGIQEVSSGFRIV